MLASPREPRVDGKVSDAEVSSTLIGEVFDALFFGSYTSCYVPWEDMATLHTDSLMRIP